MKEENKYLLKLLNDYKAPNLLAYAEPLDYLKRILKKWAFSNGFGIKIIPSGSQRKGTAISISSDVDYLLSLSRTKVDSPETLNDMYNSLHSTLKVHYPSLRQQNVSLRISLGSLRVIMRDLEIDITPARRHPGNTNNHTLYVSKKNSWQWTNISKHIFDVLKSGRTDEIKVLKIWRKLHELEFPSIYLEYLLIDNILLGRPKGKINLSENIIYALQQLAKKDGNPLFSRVMDPANFNNIISDLLEDEEKERIINKAQIALTGNWNKFVW